ncbi:phosphatase PAP2 family protein [Rhizobium mongolense]|uniref:Membrane-associated phospholipid phosphatase n=2 Tax=Rhizobium mongolense TaxID=57676 RepID=A0ABR6IWV7_9HYPH|nr:phosphatase PAP2 family protein [Rhizobium mongolense]MBB4232407.1 membrane-associated phospholipid phosphatase [Rhizobium mongolense]TVZ66639.1 PAP2 superfamily protein [Rhizobium mongolense USDA 1844]
MAYQAVPLGRAGASWTFFLLAATWLLLLSIFHAFPAMDIAVSSFFFRGALCGGGAGCGSFAFGRYESIKLLRWALYVLPYIAAVAIVIAVTAGSLSKSIAAKMPMRRLWLSLATLGLSTGLIVNLLLKNHSGRPRPIQTSLFGGHMDFMPAGSFLGQCTSNCSFVSGEASGAGWLLCLMFLLPPKARLWFGWPVAIASVATAVLRVVVGAHYISDVILGFLMPIVVFSGLIALEQRIQTPAR